MFSSCRWNSLPNEGRFRRLGDSVVELRGLLPPHGDRVAATGEERVSVGRSVPPQQTEGRVAAGERGSAHPAAPASPTKDQ